MTIEQYIDAFAHYLKSGDSSTIQVFCENPADINRLAVYRNGYYKGCVDALSANFPMCEKQLGEENFRHVARLYVDHFPPEKGTLVGYGAEFTHFLQSLINDKEFQSKHKLPANLICISQLDYAWLMSLMSANSTTTLTIEYVSELLQQGVELTEINVQLNPSVELLKVSETDFNEWISLKTNHKDIQTESTSNEWVMLWRLQGAVQARSLSTAEIALMQTIQGVTKPLGEAFESAITVDETFDVSDAFTACLHNNLLEIIN